MKKIIPIVLFLALICSGCKIQTYTPEIVDFVQSAAVTSGDFSYTCEISRKNNVVTVTATSTNAAGLSISYDGKTVVFAYEDMSYQLEGDRIDATNPAVAVYDAFNCVVNTNPPDASKTADGYEYRGSTDLGEFVLHQYDDYSYKSLYFKNANIKIEFETI